MPQSPYRRLASRLQTEFTLRAVNSGVDILTRVAMDPSVQEGCIVIAKTLRYAPAGYLAFAAGSNQGPDKQQLAGSLKGSLGAIKGFAETDRDRARIYETTFGVYPLADNEPYEPQPFIFAETPAGVRYMPSRHPYAMPIRVLQRLKGDGTLRQTGQHRRCAALGVVMESLWGRAIDICTEGPSLFPNDLSPEPIAYPTNFPYEPPE